MISYIISLFLIASLSAQEVTESPLEERGEVHSRRSSKESSRKKTVCSITINSDEEVKTFKKHLKGFDFVELVPHESESESESASGLGATMVGTAPGRFVTGVFREPI